MANSGTIMTVKLVGMYKVGLPFRHIAGVTGTNHKKLQR
jgi:hypothetical protein